MKVSSQSLDESPFQGGAAAFAGARLKRGEEEEDKEEEEEEEEKEEGEKGVRRCRREEC